MELSAADATVAEVNLRLTWYKFTPSVILKNSYRMQVNEREKFELHLRTIAKVRFSKFNYKTE